jgi:hypothetical protein
MSVIGKRNVFTKGSTTFSDATLESRPAHFPRFTDRHRGGYGLWNRVVVVVNATVANQPGECRAKASLPI